MSALAKRLEMAANVSIIVAVVLLAAIAVQTFILRPAAGPPTMQRIPAGTKIALPNVDWNKTRHTLLLALSVNCHFCSESAPFYQRLLAETATRSDVQLVAVLPQQLTDAQTYLQSLNVAIPQVRQAALSSISVMGTPTLILVNNQGLVTDSWIGKLPPDKESEVLKKLE